MSTRSRFHCSSVLFDLDGVLVDSSSSVEMHWTAWAHRRGVSPHDVLAAIHGRRAIDTIRLMRPDLDPIVEAEDLSQREAGDTEGCVAVSGAVRLVASLPIDAWAVVTSGTRLVAFSRLNHAKITLPDVLVSADDVTRGKPDPEGYLRAAMLKHVSPSECLVFEDAPAGVVAARAAGMTVVGVGTSHSRSQLAGAHEWVRNLDDVTITRSPSIGGGLIVEITDDNSET